MNTGLACVFGLMLFLTGAVRAEQPGADWRLSPREIRDAVRQTVEEQLAALRQQDFGRAYQQASRGIRRQFPEAVFAAMIKRGYPALVRQVRAELGVVRDNRDTRAWVAVTVTDRLERSTDYRYYLVREGDAWRIEGVVGEERATRGDI